LELHLQTADVLLCPVLAGYLTMKKELTKCVLLSILKFGDFIIILPSFRKAKIMVKATMPHPGHENHLCYLNNLGLQISNPKEYKALVKNAQFVCKICGRVAADEKNLCKPVKL
jgi:hypothetical protein